MLYTTNFCPMGSGERTMSVFAKRLKNGRSWYEEGITKFSDIMIALMDGQDLITQRGKFKRLIESDQRTRDDKPPKHFVERLTNHVQDTTRKQYSLFTTVYTQACCSRFKRIKGLLISIKSISRRYTRRLQRVGKKGHVL